MHAFWFLALLPLSLLPEVALAAGLLVLPAHGLWALQRVYGGRWWATLARAMVVAAIYLPAFFATIVGLSMASVFLV